MARLNPAIDFLLAFRQHIEVAFGGGRQPLDNILQRIFVDPVPEVKYQD
jgi:hypothetical protein